MGRGQLVVDQAGKFSSEVSMEEVPGSKPVFDPSQLVSEHQHKLGD